MTIILPTLIALGPWSDAGGYPWTVIPLDKRNDYMETLEGGSVDQNIEPVAIFLGRLVADHI